MYKKRDLSNVAYTDEYLDKREVKIAAVIRPENITDTAEELAEQGHSQAVIRYEAVHDGLRYSCSHNKVYNPNKLLIHEYISLYSHSFCTPITHSNGRQYLVYKEDLCGYSVLDIESKGAFRYIPAESLHGGETFIITNISYNPSTDIVVAGGYYWAYPSGTFLLEIKDPMKQFSRYLDFHSILGGFDKYDDIDFQGWADTNILLKGYNIEQEPCHEETIKVTHTEYEKALQTW